MFTKFEFISRSFFLNGFVQEGRVEWYALISSVRPLAVEQPLTGRHWNQPKKDIPHPKIKKKSQWHGTKCTIRIKSNLTPDEWMTHTMPKKLSHCCEVLSPLSGFPAWWPSKGTRNPWESHFEGQWDLVTGLPLDWEKEVPLLEGKNKIIYTPGAWGKEQWPHRRLSQTYQLVLEDLLWRCGLAVTCLRDGALAPEILGGAHQSNTQFFPSFPPTRKFTQDSASITRDHTEKEKNSYPTATRMKTTTQKVKQNEKAEDYVPDEGRR